MGKHILSTDVFDAADAQKITKMAFYGYLTGLVVNRLNMHYD